jgi:ABC-2 type transport system permease protein
MGLAQLKYEQLAFWRNPLGAGFTVGFSLVFLLLLGASGGGSRAGVIGGVKLIQYYVPGFLAYGVMATGFSTLSVNMVFRRQTGLLKRLRLSPVPVPVFLGAIFANVLLLCAFQVVLLLAVGRLAYHVQLPHNYAALVLTLAVGVVCFSALGLAVSTLLPNEDAAPPVVNIVFFVLLFLSGLWYPIKAGSSLARIAGYFPVRHLITATFAPFDLRPGVSAWSWGDLEAIAVWGAVAVFVCLRRMQWAPIR